MAIQLTPKRLAWLEHLNDFGPANRSRSRIGYDCMHEGWTEWNYVRPDGSPINEANALAEYGEQWFNQVSHAGERITDMGRLALSKARSQPLPDKPALPLQSEE